LDKPQRTFAEVYNFVRDRTRAIRTDFTLQNYHGPESVEVNEKICRFHIISSHRLCEEPDTVYNDQQNMEQLGKVLQTLMELYDDANCSNISYPFEAEFRAYYILTQIESAEIMGRAERWKPAVFESDEVQNALRFHELVQNKLVAAVFSRTRSPRTSYLQSCLLQRLFIAMRREGLKALNSSHIYKDKAFPVSLLTQIMAFDSAEDAVEYCQHWGLEIDPEKPGESDIGIRFGKKDGGRVLWIGRA
jgi:hypothetical protein